MRRNHSLDRGGTIPSLSVHLSIFHYFFFLCLWICLFITCSFFLCLCMRMSVIQNGSAKSNLTLANPQIIVFHQKTKFKQSFSFTTNTSEKIVTFRQHQALYISRLDRNGAWQRDSSFFFLQIFPRRCFYLFISRDKLNLEGMALGSKGGRGN